MNISYRWLQDLVPGLSLSPQQLADRLAMLGAPVDEVTDLGSPLSQLVIGRVISAKRHPNADRLSVCTVDAGVGYPLNVVCGAPNVREGAFYPFAPVGASLPGDVTIRKARIRGEESQGMLCSARELGLGRDHEGILELHGEFEPGRSFIESIGLDDTRLVVDITPNRADLLSHIGVAREIAAAEGLRVRPVGPSGTPPADVELSAETLAAHPAMDLRLVAGPPREPVSAGGVTIRIDDLDLCPTYIGLIIRGVRVGPSPAWLAGRLRAIGLRPISNVVDATNFVLHELGQPLHAFDLDRLGTDVVVRRAARGEAITTLDGIERKLEEGMLVIADASRPVAIAGVMGGADTEVQEDTRDILLECAFFEPRSVRATRRALGLSTDASYRFERGVDPDGLPRAAARAAMLITEVAGGTVDANGISAGGGVPKLPGITLRLRRVEQLLGQPFSAEQVREYLKPLGFRTTVDGDVVHVDVPGHRHFDVSREEDLIEEIARRHGYDAFPDDLRAFRPGVVPPHPLFALEDRLRTLLVGRGLLEARTAAFAPVTDGDVELLLPLAATESRLRRALLPGLLRRVEYNYARGARSIRLFELGTVFSAGPPGEPPAEATHLAVTLTGPRRPPHWSEADAAFDAWDLKDLAQDLADQLGLRLEQGADHPLLETPLSFRLLASDNAGQLGVAGLVRKGAVDAPAWAGDVWAVEVELRADMLQPQIRARPLPAYPANERDLALLLRHELPAGAVAEAIRSAAGPLLEQAAPFDVYSGRGVPAEVRSVAYRLRFRAPDRTLTDAEVDDLVKAVLKHLNDELGVQQRA
jgi:phenylalanyl-tRNA synthetase beta chain